MERTSERSERGRRHRHRLGLYGPDRVMYNPPMLTGKQRHYLRGLAHSLRPLVQVGKDNVNEALIAAMYTDGGIDPVRRFVLDHVVASFDVDLSEDEGLVVDYKSALQEAATSRGLPVPRAALDQLEDEPASSGAGSSRIGR